MRVLLCMLYIYIGRRYDVTPPSADGSYCTIHYPPLIMLVSMSEETN